MLIHTNFVYVSAYFINKSPSRGTIERKCKMNGTVIFTLPFKELGILFNHEFCFSIIEKSNYRFYRATESRYAVDIKNIILAFYAFHF